LRPHASIPFASAAITTLALMATPAWAQPADVNVVNDSFTPNAATVVQGETVTWHFQENGHNVDVTDGPEKFASPKTSNGGTFQHTFNKPGTYSYICDYHPSKMKGTITVQAAPTSNNGGGATQPTPSGSTAQPTTGSSPSTAPSAGADPAAASGSLGAVDAAAPSLRSLGVRSGRLALKVSEDGRLVIRYVKAGAPGHVVHKRILRAHKGTVRLSLRRWMRSGRYRVHVIAYDAAGNASRPVRLSAVVR
jgi:plastocyanin